MALVLGDRVKVRSRTTGTGDFLLENTVDGFQGFDAIGDGNETFYSIVDAAGNWEVGRGTYTSLTSTLARDSILSSSNANAKVNFPAGSKNVFCTYPASIATTVTTGGGLSSDSFKTIQISGQSDVVADSATDILTLAAGSGIAITSSASTDTITISNNLVNTLLTEVSGVVCTPGVDTVIFTSSYHNIVTIKLLVQAEGNLNDPFQWDSQSCEIIVSKAWRNNTVSASVFGLVYSSTSALATFNASWNPTTSRTEVTCRPTSLTDSVTVMAYATEIYSAD